MPAEWSVWPVRCAVSTLQTADADNADVDGTGCSTGCFGSTWPLPHLHEMWALRHDLRSSDSAVAVGSWQCRRRSGGNYVDRAAGCDGTDLTSGCGSFHSHNNHFGCSQNAALNKSPFISINLNH